MPAAVQIHAIEEVPLKTTALQSVLIGADYTIIIYAEPGEIDPQQIETAIANFLAKSELWSEARAQRVQISLQSAPAGFELRYEGYDGDSEEHRIFLRVQQREGATGRPDEVVSALGLDDFARTLRRLRLYTSDNTADAALFAQYPLVDKADINVELGGRRRKAARSAERWRQARGKIRARVVRSMNGRQMSLYKTRNPHARRLSSRRNLPLWIQLQRHARRVRCPNCRIGPVWQRRAAFYRVHVTEIARMPKC
ncbi:MAG: hypothetical protein R2911_00845 [Caldilineaceae bacterium]